MVVSKTGLINSFWSMIIPGAVPVMYVIMMMNFFRSLPPELEEAALIDGANQWQICCRSCSTVQGLYCDDHAVLHRQSLELVV